MPPWGRPFCWSTSKTPALGKPSFFSPPHRKAKKRCIVDLISSNESDRDGADGRGRRETLAEDLNRQCLAACSGGGTFVSTSHLLAGARATFPLSGATRKKAAWPSSHI